jgi:hypothetical protein
MNKLKKFLPSLFWILVLAILIYFHRFNPLNSDEGLILNGAWNLINNRKLYFDFFEYIPPGSFYIIFFIWKISTPSYLIAKIFSVLIVFLSLIGIFKINKLINPKISGYFLVFFYSLTTFAWPLINHNTFNQFFLIYAIYFFLKFIQNKKNLKLLYSSFFILGSGALFLQQKSLLLFLGFILYLIILNFNNFKTFKSKLKSKLKIIIISFLAFSLPILSLFFFWPLKLLFDNLIIFPLFNYSKINFGYVSHSLFIAIIILFSIFNIILFKLNQNFQFNKKFKNLNLNLITTLTFIQLFLLISVIPNHDYYHLGLIGFPLYIMLVFILKILIKFNQSDFFQLFKKLLLIFYIIVYIFILTIFIKPFLNQENNKILKFKKIVKNNCKNQSDLYAGPFLPGLYFEFKKLNPTPFSILLTNLNPNQHFLEAKKALIDEKNKCVILNYQMVEKFNYNKKNPLDQYIEDNYKIHYQEENLIFLIKK